MSGRRKDWSSLSSLTKQWSLEDEEELERERRRRIRTKSTSTEENGTPRLTPNGDQQTKHRLPSVEEESPKSHPAHPASKNEDEDFQTILRTREERWQRRQAVEGAQLPSPEQLEAQKGQNDSGLGEARQQSPVPKEVDRPLVRRLSQERRGRWAREEEIMASSEPGDGKRPLAEKALSPQKTLVSEKALSLEKTQVSEKGATEKILSPEKTRSSVSEKTLSQGRKLVSERAPSLDMTRVSEKALSLEKTQVSEKGATEKILSPEKTRTSVSEKTSSQGRKLVSERTPSLDMTQVSEKALSLEKTQVSEKGATEKILSPEKTRSSVSEKTSSQGRKLVSERTPSLDMTQVSEKALSLEKTQVSEKGATEKTRSSVSERTLSHRMRLVAEETPQKDLAPENMSVAEKTASLEKIAAGEKMAISEKKAVIEKRSVEEKPPAPRKMPGPERGTVSEKAQMFERSLGSQKTPAPETKLMPKRGVASEQPPAQKQAGSGGSLVPTRQLRRELSKEKPPCSVEVAEQEPSSNPPVSARFKPVTLQVKIPSQQEEVDITSPTQTTYSTSLKRSSPRTLSFRMSPKKDSPETSLTPLTPLTRSASLRIPSKIEDKLERYHLAVKRTESVKYPASRTEFIVASSGGRVASRRHLFEKEQGEQSQAESTSSLKDKLKLSGAVTSKVNLWISKSQEPREHEAQEVQKEQVVTKNLK